MIYSPRTLDMWQSNSFLYALAWPTSLNPAPMETPNKIHVSDHRKVTQYTPYLNTHTATRLTPPRKQAYPRHNTETSNTTTEQLTIAQQAKNPLKTMPLKTFPFLSFQNTCMLFKTSYTLEMATLARSSQKPLTQEHYTNNRAFAQNYVKSSHRN